MTDKDLNQLKMNLVALFTIFKDKPNLLVKYILEYDIIPSNIKKNIINNEELCKKSEELEVSEDDVIEQPFFTDIKNMLKYYDVFFKTTDDLDNIININQNQKEALLQELKEAIKNEDFEKCAKIRDFCNKKKIVLNL